MDSHDCSPEGTSLGRCPASLVGMHAAPSSVDLAFWFAFSLFEEAFVAVFVASWALSDKILLATVAIIFPRLPQPNPSSHISIAQGHT